MNSSSAKERRALILRMLEQKEEVFVTEISRETGISEVTIRKDLTILQNRHLLLRTRGGAMRRPVDNPNDDTAISRKQMFNFREKERIGAEAAKLIKDGDYSTTKTRMTRSTRSIVIYRSSPTTVRPFWRTRHRSACAATLLWVFPRNRTVLNSRTSIRC